MPWRDSCMVDDKGKLAIIGGTERNPTRVLKLTAQDMREIAVAVRDGIELDGRRYDVIRGLEFSQVQIPENAAAFTFFCNTLAAAPALITLDLEGNSSYSTPLTERQLTQLLTTFSAAPYLRELAFIANDKPTSAPAVAAFIRTNTRLTTLKCDIDDQLHGHDYPMLRAALTAEHSVLESLVLTSTSYCDFTPLLINQDIVHPSRRALRVAFEGHDQVARLVYPLLTSSHPPVEPTMSFGFSGFVPIHRGALAGAGIGASAVPAPLCSGRAGGASAAASGLTLEPVPPVGAGAPVSTVHAGFFSGTAGGASASASGLALEPVPAAGAGSGGGASGRGNLKRGADVVAEDSGSCEEGEDDVGAPLPKKFFTGGPKS